MNSQDAKHPENQFFRFEVGKASHPGKIRSRNEDSVLIRLPHSEAEPDRVSCGLFAVADGVGGQDAGEVASALALKTLVQGFDQAFQEIMDKGNGSRPNEQYIRGILSDIVMQTNREVFSQREARSNNMGTTLATALVLGDTVYIANVGDSRVYLLDEGQLRQITADHSLIAAFVKAGKVTPEQAYTDIRRNIITRCIGKKDVEVDTFVEKLKAQSRLILCSDGLWEMVRDNDIKDVLLNSENAQQVCDRLVGLANDNGGTDNISVIVVKLSHRN